MIRIIRIFFLLVFVVIFLLIIVFSLQMPRGVSDRIEWDITFSRIFAKQMGLDWQEVYLAILDDLNPKSIRLPIYWEDIEPEIEDFQFIDYDWMIKEAEKRNVKLILVVGKKLPRWPECHLPEWANALSGSQQQERVLKEITQIVERYKNSSSLYLWQIENEPFLMFGECPLPSSKALDEEISLVKSLDPNHKILITDSGEISIWLPAAKRGEIFGTTMYRIVENRLFGQIKYPLPPRFFWLKANFLQVFYPDKPIIVSELQAEPWSRQMLYETTLEEQAKSMNIKQFHENIGYARQVGFSPVYLWGAEWWYWMKIKHNDNSFWQAAKLLIAEHKSSERVLINQN
jgi:hypothetical protein